MKFSNYMKSMVLSSVLASSLFAGLQAQDQGGLLQEKSRAFVGVQVGTSLLQNTEKFFLE